MHVPEGAAQPKQLRQPESDSRPDGDGLCTAFLNAGVALPPAALGWCL